MGRAGQGGVHGSCVAIGLSGEQEASGKDQQPPADAFSCNRDILSTFLHLHHQEAFAGRLGLPGGWGAAGGCAAQWGWPISAPRNPVVLFTLILSASKARSGSRLFISVWRAQAVKSTIIFLLLCQHLQQAGKEREKKKILKGLSDLRTIK